MNSHSITPKLNNVFILNYYLNGFVVADPQPNVAVRLSGDVSFCDVQTSHCNAIPTGGGADVEQIRPYIVDLEYKTKTDFK